MTEFDADLTLSREPVMRYLVETSMPGTGGYWLRASTPHVSRELAQQTLDTLAASPTADPTVTRRIGAEVVLRYASVALDDVLESGCPDFRLTARWKSDTLAYHAPRKSYTIPLTSPQTGDIDLEISEADLNRLLNALQACRWSLDPNLAGLVPCEPSTQEPHNG